MFLYAFLALRPEIYLLISNLISVFYKSPRFFLIYIYTVEMSILNKEIILL